MKKKKKGDAHVTFDDERALFSHTPGLILSHFVSSPEDVYFQSDEFYVYSKNTKDEPQHHVAFLSSMCDDCYDNVDQNNRDYSFLRFAPCDFNEESDIKYETLDVSRMSNVNDDNIEVSGMDLIQSEHSVKPTTLSLWHKCHMTMEMILQIGSLIVEARIA